MFCGFCTTFLKKLAQVLLAACSIFVSFHLEKGCWGETCALPVSLVPLGAASPVSRRLLCFHWPQTRSAHLSTRAALTDGATALSRRDCPSSCAAAFGTEKQRNRLTLHAPAKTQCCAFRCFSLCHSLFFFLPVKHYTLLGDLSKMAWQGVAWPSPLFLVFLISFCDCSEVVAGDRIAVDELNWKAHFIIPAALGTWSPWRPWKYCLEWYLSFPCFHFLFLCISVGDMSCVCKCSHVQFWVSVQDMFCGCLLTDTLLLVTRVHLWAVVVSWKWGVATADADGVGKKPYSTAENYSLRLHTWRASVTQHGTVFLQRQRVAHEPCDRMFYVNFTCTNPGCSAHARLEALSSWV